jgi:hypothetical protein
MLSVLDSTKTYCNVRQSQQYINEGHKYNADIDLKTFFDEVDHVCCFSCCTTR